MGKTAPQQDIAHSLEDLDRVVGHPTLVHQELTPPAYGAAHRDGISSLVDAITTDLCEKVAQLRKQLDHIAQAALQSAARSKGSLNEHVIVCSKLNDEVVRLQDVITGLEQGTREQS